MRMRAHATGQYINEGFGMFVGLRGRVIVILPKIQTTDMRKKN